MKKSTERIDPMIALKELIVEGRSKWYVKNSE